MVSRHQGMLVLSDSRTLTAALRLRTKPIQLTAYFSIQPWHQVGWRPYRLLILIPNIAIPMAAHFIPAANPGPPRVAE